MKTVDLGLLMARVLDRLVVISEVSAVELKEPTKGGKKTSTSPSQERLGFPVVMSGSPETLKIQRKRFAAWLISTDPEGNEIKEPTQRDSRGVEWYRRAFRKAHSDTERWVLLRGAMDELYAIRFSRRFPKFDVKTRDDRLAVGREAIQLGVGKVAALYGYSRQHVHALKREAEAQALCDAGLRELHRYAGSLEERCMIAAEPGSSREVAERYENVSAESVRRWRRGLGVW